MPQEIDLYFFDGSAQAAEHLEMLRQLFDNEQWSTLQLPVASTSPHFSMRLAFVGPTSTRSAPSPAMTYLASALSMQTEANATLAAVSAIFLSVAPVIRQRAISSLSVTLPDKRRIRFDASTVPSVAISDAAGVLDEYVVPLDATERDIAQLQLIQKLEYSSDVRIKLASLDDKNRYVGDAHDEYETFLADLPQGWWQEGGEFQIQTRSENKRRAWHLRGKDQVDVAVVEHETGVELLLTLIGGVATSALYDLAKWALKSWLDKRRDPSKRPTFLEVERVRRGADGTVLGSERIRVRAPVEDRRLQLIIDQYLRDARPEDGH